MCRKVCVIVQYICILFVLSMNNSFYCTMKRLLLFFTLTLMTLTLYATGQEGDIIYMDGMQWELLGKPIYADSALNRKLKETLPERHGWTTSNWDGYTAYWSIQQKQLCLDSIQYTIYDADPKKSRTECLSSDVLFRTFKKYFDGKHIVATWLNGDIRVASGKVIYYRHTGYERNYENERFISIEHGKVRGMKDYQNYVVEGFSFDHPTRPQGNNYLNNINADLREMFPLHLEQYPELADVKRIVFRIKRARVDAQGNLVECEVRVVRPGDNPRLAAEMAEAMKAYHPWRVFYINGEYRAYGIEGYTIVYKNKE